MLSSNRYLTFSRGLRDGLPIALGYISVAFAFGILAVEKGLPAWSPILISVTNFTGTGQFAGIDLIAAMASFAEIAFTLIIINLRYLLMSLSLSQRLEPGMGLGKRMAIAFGITDEIFAVAIQKESLLGGKYLAGLILSSYSGWVGGTVLGALASSLLPASLLSALGIALYAMFIAIIIPPARSSRPVALVILIAVCLSCLFRYVPFLSGLSSGWVIIISGLVSALIGTFLFPMQEDKEEEADE